MLKWINTKNEDKEEMVTIRNREERKLRQLIEEMVATERKYVEDLDEVVKNVSQGKSCR